MLLKRLLLLFFILMSGQSSFGQITKDEHDPWHREYKPGRLKAVVAGGTVFYAGTMLGLYSIWYKDYERVGLHLFNDNAGWEKIDKWGHAYTSYIMGKGGIEALKWTGVDRKKAIWLGGSYGFLYLSTVEFIDGHYAAWGVSLGDLACNALGSLFLISQELAFKRQVITMKYSYHPTHFAELNPNHLGHQPLEKMIKDYNGHTYWLSVNYRSIFRNHRIVPNWLSISGGYGATGMLGGNSNPPRFDHIDRYQQYFLTLDIDFDKIQTKSKFLKTTFFFLNLLKFPLPTLEFNTNGETIFHPIYF